MSSARHVVDSKTAQRLRSRRLLVVDADAARAEAFARALQDAGAAAVAVSPDDTRHAAAHALDPDVMLVNEDEPEPCTPLVIALRRHPRTRWTTVLPISFAALWPQHAGQPNVAAIAEEVNRLATSLIELTVRARGKLPHETVLEPLGPSRILRALANTGRSLRVVLSDASIRAEIELGERRVGARASLTGSDRPLTHAEALAAVLAMASGRVRIEESGEARLPGWNVSLPAAFEAAAAIAWSCAEGDDEPPAPVGSGVRPAVSENLSALRQAHAASAAPNLQPTVPQIMLSEAYAEAVATDLSIETTPNAAKDASSIYEKSMEVILDPADFAEASPEHDAPALLADARPRRTRRAFTLALVLAVAGALAWVLHTHPTLTLALPRLSSIVASATAKTEPKPPRAAPATAIMTARDVAAQVEPAPVAAAPVEAAPAAPLPEPREPTPAELKQARSLTKRGHYYLRGQHEGTAANAYLKALALVPDHVPAIAPLIRIYLQEGNAAEAQRWAEQLAQLEPNSVTSQQLLGEAYALSGDQTLAAAAWQRAGALAGDATP